MFVQTKQILMAYNTNIADIVLFLCKFALFYFFIFLQVCLFC